MSRNIVTRLVLALALVLCFTGPAAAGQAIPARQLVLIDLPAGALAPAARALAAAGAPVYGRLAASDGLHLLAGLAREREPVLSAAGVSYRVLDPDTAGRTYYLVYPAPGKAGSLPPQDAEVLYRDARVLVIRADAAAAERLAAAGAEIALVTLDPKPLGAAARATAAFPQVTTPDPVVRWMVDQVRQDTVRQYDGDLSGAWDVTIRSSPYRILTRNTNSGTPIQQATYFVGDHLRALGLAVQEQRWRPVNAPNVIGEKTGTARPGDIFMITAHLDNMPTGAVAPGADDNASGSVAVLVAADILSQFSWDCTLRFALWTGEEQGLLGSADYAADARAANENILGVFNLDMIAWNTPDSPPEIDLHADGSMPATVELANQAASVIDAYDLALIPEVRADGTGSSDHASFWDQNYTAILGIEDYYPDDHDFDPYYHKTSDTLSTLNLGYFSEYVKAAVAETAHMAGCLTTGTMQGRVLASHDGSPIPNATITVKDATGREYVLRAGTDGRYNQALPPGTYAATVSAYGYGTETWNGIAVTANGSATRDFTLAAAAPVAPSVAARLDGGEVLLSWPHISPNTAYEVHRDTAPYFAPNAGSRVVTLDAAHLPSAGETLTYLDAESDAGDPSVNDFYAVVGLSAAGAGGPRCGAGSSTTRSCGRRARRTSIIRRARMKPLPAGCIQTSRSCVRHDQANDREITMKRAALLMTLLMLASVVLAACGGSTAPAPAAQTDVKNLPDNVTIAQTKELLGRSDVMILDVREQSEYDAGHIPGVTLIPTGQVANRLSEIPKDKPVIVTCRSGNRSATITKFLREQGYTNVHNMEGGIVAWQGAGYPVEK